MATDNARSVRITVNNDGEVLRVRDPGLDDNRPWIDAVFPKRGRVYGWEMASRLTGGQIRRPTYRGTVDATASDSDDATDRQTLQVPGSYLVKLDVGYWGHYLRDQPGQRDFGLIEGADVWLCSYKGNVRTTNDPNLMPANGTLAYGLIERLESAGRYLLLHKHTTIQANPDAAVPAADRLYVCFPDLHLPEQWPDLYPNATRLAPGPQRAALRFLLRQSQCRPGATNDSLLTQANLDTLQTALDGWASGGTGNLVITFDASVSVYIPPTPDAMPVFTPNSITLNLTRDQVLAEKNHLDREIQAKSTWFYPARAVGTVTRRPITTDPNEVDAPEDSMDDDPIAVVPSVSSMPAPAADLADFLFLVREHQRARGAANVKVVQVGDLYELWMNREFMYKDAPAVTADELGQIRADGVPAVSVTAVLNYTEFEFKDSFQLRMGREWSGSSGAPHAAARYVYHRWTRSELYRRHDVAGAIPGPAQTRLQRRLLERIESVSDWTYAEPARDPLLPGLRSWMAGKPRGTFTRTNLRGATETRWNKVILELLQELRAVRIHGNHDGYRSDTRLLVDRSNPAASTEWFSETGVWVEHSHRWDYFNRDGVAMGAGMTNVVYYHNEELIAASGGAAAALLRQEQCFFQAGAAQWYLLINYGSASWFSGSIQKFGVYVGGHTHGPDLVKIYFEQSTVGAINDWTEQRRQDLEAAQRRAREAAAEAARRARETADEIGRGASAAARRARRRLGQIYDDYWPF